MISANCKEEQTTEPVLYLAPIRGLTDFTFRNCFASHFEGFDCCIAPFINPQRHSAFKSKHLRDILPENNRNLSVIPQLLHTDPEDFLVLSNRIADLGYTEINWNLGCPAPMVTHKKRGSGFLPFGDEIISFLDNVMPKLPISLSIKTRLGFESISEQQGLIPRLNDFPLKELIIHARLGKQMYRGTTDPDGFFALSRLTRHRLVYNGDITTWESFISLQEQFPQITRWMIGRGAIADPFLPAKLKHPELVTCKKAIHEFHNDLYKQYQQRLSGPAHILGRMKQVWQYLISSFPNQEKLLKKINKAKTLDKYETAALQLFGK